MAAGLVSHNLTTASGVSFTVRSWVPDTAAPDVNAVPVHIAYDSAGSEVLTAAQVVSLLGYLDGVESLLTTIDGRVDGLETLIGTTNTKIDTLTAAATPAGSSIIGKVGIDQTSGQNKVAIVDISEAEYETVAASQTAQVLGATGGTGDFISGVLVIPTTVSPGVVTLLDNATSIPIFAGGTNSLSNLVPFFIPLGMKSVSGAWKLTTGAGLSCIGIGNFT